MDFNLECYRIGGKVLHLHIWVESCSGNLAMRHLEISFINKHLSRFEDHELLPPEINY